MCVGHGCSMFAVVTMDYSIQFSNQKIHKTIFMEITCVHDSRPAVSVTPLYKFSTT